MYTQTIPKTTHTHLQTQHTPTLDHSRSQPHAHTSSCWPWLMPLKSSCSNSCPPLFPDLHRNQSLAVIGSRSAFLLGKEECSEKEERERQREAGWRRKKGRGRWFGHGPVWEYLITNIKNTTERLCHIPTVQLQPGPDSTVINTSYRVAPECTYSTTHTTHAHTVETHLQIHERYIWISSLELLGCFFTSKVKCMHAHKYTLAL